MWNQCLQQLIEWNVFKSDEQEFLDDNEENQTTATNPHLLQRQRVATRVYAICFTTSLFVLVLWTLLSWQTKVITIYNPSLKTYRELQRKYPTNLNCPCAANTMSYKHFIITETAMHQICSSDFISTEWIDALYLANASIYGAIDFRTSAHAQFVQLKVLCTSARDSISDALYDLNNTQMLTASALPEKEIVIQTKINEERIRTDKSVRWNNALKLIRLSTLGNKFSSALNTNKVFAAAGNPQFHYFSYWSADVTWYSNKNNRSSMCLCRQTVCSSPAGFYSLADIDDFDVHTRMRSDTYVASEMVPGFVSSCISLDAILQAKFVCLYDRKCLRKLSLYFTPMTSLLPKLRTLNKTWPSQYPHDVSVTQLVNALFLEKWIISVNYSRYYNECAPQICTYLHETRADFVYMIGMLISLYGGLQTILRLVIPPLVRHIMKKRFRLNDDVFVIEVQQRNLRKRIVEQSNNYFRRLKDHFLKWNLFKSTIRSAEALHQQRLSTKIYFSLLIGSVFLLLLFTTISEQTAYVTSNHPSYDDYKQLYTKYSDKLICPCSEILPSYASFVDITPIHHPVCSSAFVKDIWFDQLKHTKPVVLEMMDWRLMSIGYFQSLATLCNLAENTIRNDLQVFRKRSIVTTRLLSEDSLHNEINNTLDALIRSMQTEFYRVNNVLALLNQVNQYFAESNDNGHLEISYSTAEQRTKVKFLFERRAYDTSTSTCTCAFNLSCAEPMMIFHKESVRVIVPGMIWRCSAMESILYSTLECLYSNTNCLRDILLRYINYTSAARPVPPLKVSQLIRTTTRSMVVVLVKHLFVEEWRTSLSHLKYFQTCAPIFCQYTYVKRADYLYVITMFLAVYSGLTLALGLLVPLMVKLILRCQYRPVPTVRETVERLPPMIRVRTFCQRFFQSMKMKIMDFNVFPTYSFGANIDRETRLRLSRHATRLYLCLYMIGLTTLICYISIEQRTLTTKIYNPSILITRQVLEKYISTAECLCEKASIPIEAVVQIRTRFHPICTSSFVKSEWYTAFKVDTEQFYKSNYSDYRPFLSAHLQFLSGLCQHALQHVNDTVRLFTSTSFLTSRLLSQASFDKQLSNLLYQIEGSIPTNYARALELVEAINHGNRLMSVYDSNYEFTARKTTRFFETVLYTLPRTYGQSSNCSCGSETTCLSPAAFTWPDYVVVKGLSVGCTPSESLLASTLECFFDATCVNLIHQRMFNNILRVDAPPLNVKEMMRSRFKINSTVNELLARLFMEEWSTKILYERYFAQCAPTMCSYSYIDNTNPLYVATKLLGLYGGLTVVLSWWCPQLVSLARRIQMHYKRNRQTGVSSSTS